MSSQLYNPASYGEEFLREAKALVGSSSVPVAIPMEPFILASWASRTPVATAVRTLLTFTKEKKEGVWRTASDEKKQAVQNNMNKMVQKRIEKYGPRIMTSFNLAHWWSVFHLLQLTHDEAAEAYHFYEEVMQDTSTDEYPLIEIEKAYYV